MKIRRYILHSLALVLAMCGIAAAAIPGPQRAFAPTLYGLSEISPNVFTDDVSQKDKWLDIEASANERTEGFFGTLLSNPRYILCSHLACEHSFGKNGNVAQSYGWSLIHIPPKALENRSVGVILMSHERVHAELTYRWGASAIWDGKIPSWFNEGLATMVSQDYRVRSFYGQLPAYSKEDRNWIEGSKYFWDWNRFVGERGWHTAYGAAGEKVAQMQARVGQAGLRRLMDSAIYYGGFEEIMSEMMSKPHSILTPASSKILK